MKNWSCAKCGTTIQKDSQPSRSGCPATNNGHWWVDLGKTGNTTFQCTKCGIVIYSASEPNRTGCTNSKSGHYWDKL